MKMRKYQQLLLLVISGISVAVLLMYKSENNRLKDVLHVINFFGRNDVALVERLENNALSLYAHDYSYPFGVWQSLSDNFYVYSSYWRRNDLVAGGEVISIVVGCKGAMLNFKCAVNYGSGITYKQSKFRFQRMDKPGEDDLSEFTRYHFYCRVLKNLGQPRSVTFIDLTENKTSTRGGRTLKLRHIKSTDNGKKYLQPMTVCLQLLEPKSDNISPTMQQYRNILQFFIHHYTLGIEDFIVYNADELSDVISSNLSLINIRLHPLPFNFPYLINIKDMERIRYIVETDCLLRNTNRARYTILLGINEFFYPFTKLDHEISILKSLKNYSNQVTRFELPVFTVCKDQSRTFLMDNNLYDPEMHLKYKLFIYRLIGNSDIGNNSGHIVTSVAAATTTQNIALPLSKAFAHHYDNCVTVGKDGLHDWRNSIREDFMVHLQNIKKEMKVFI